MGEGNHAKGANRPLFLCSLGMMQRMKCGCVLLSMHMRLFNDSRYIIDTVIIDADLPCKKGTYPVRLETPFPLTFFLPVVGGAPFAPVDVSASGRIELVFGKKRSHQQHSHTCIKIVANGAIGPCSSFLSTIFETSQGVQLRNNIV